MTIALEDLIRGAGRLAFGPRCNLTLLPEQVCQSGLHVLGVALRSIRISRLGMILSCQSRGPKGVGRGNGTPNSVVEDGCTLPKILTIQGKYDRSGTGTALDAVAHRCNGRYQQETKSMIMPSKEPSLRRVSQKLRSIETYPESTSPAEKLPVYEYFSAGHK